LLARAGAGLLQSARRPLANYIEGTHNRGEKQQCTFNPTCLM